MSKFVIYLKLQPFVAQWLHHHYGDPVRFQPMSVENATILQFTQKLPAGKEPDTSVQGLTAVCIPDNEKKGSRYLQLPGEKRQRGGCGLHRTDIQADDVERTKRHVCYWLLGSKCNRCVV